MNSPLASKLDDYTFYTVPNVASYSHVSFNSWSIDCNPSDALESRTTENVYLIIDTMFHEAFVHWVVESAIYLPLFKKLKGQYPTLKLHLSCYKKYKLFFIKHFGILESDIVYTLPTENMCIFPSPISALNANTISDEFKRQFTGLYTSFHTHKNKSVNILLMPRSKVENYAGNDRFIDTIDIETKISAMDTCAVFYTDTINSLQQQIDTIASSKNIIVPDGSAFLVNGLFAQDSNLIVMGDFTKSQTQSYIKMKYIYDTIASKNTIHYIPFIHGAFHNSTFRYEDIQKYCI
jgi:hypothetical protein